jgi:membrane-associated protease RseP (regulator of RpoE activity)
LAADAAVAAVYNSPFDALAAESCAERLMDHTHETPVESQIDRVAPTQPAPHAPPRRPRIALPIFLFAATSLSTYLVGGLSFSLALMTTLLAHELGHFLQALRYHVPASLPYFIPLPQSPIGTMGAVIVMQPGMGDRRSLFDIGITGPLAGLVPALIFSIVGLHGSHVVPVAAHHSGLTLGEPLLFKLLTYSVFGPIPAGADVVLHPMAYAGWVGIFITALNLFPIGQLDGGHVLYALLLRRAHGVAQGLLLAVMLAVVVWGYWGWTLMTLLLMWMGPLHPPTANDDVPLGTARTILGWATLAFVPLGFTPVPFS